MHNGSLPGAKWYTLRNRVSYTEFYDRLTVLRNTVAGQTIYTSSYSNYNSTTHYSYDISGNVDTLLQDYRLGLMAAHGFNRFKLMAYKFDLISGKVNQVHYQPDEVDAFYHRYEYDAENRLTDVYTTNTNDFVGVPDLEEHEARYSYYKHGPMARTVIGQQQVQGMDYAYTLQGWLKGVNSASLDPNFDMGGDGKVNGTNQQIARDAFGFNLNYFAGEYNAINGIVNPFPGHSGFLPGNEYRPLYNGNISSMAVNIGKLSQPQLYNYQYDQLNRLVGMDVYRGLNQGSNDWTALTPTLDYKERIGYDGNGNILSYLRNGTTANGSSQLMDNLQYRYFRDATGNLRNNRLRLVNDDPALTGNYSQDIDDQTPAVANAADSNYVYDGIGNLIADKAEKINTISWSVYGKILSIAKTPTSSNSTQNIIYTYDADGNRISKVVDKQGTNVSDYTWYVRDAAGNVVALYHYTGNNLNNGTLNLTEQHLYGSSRLGILNTNVNVDVPGASTNASLVGPTYLSNFTRGNKIFELSNHLGNVLVSITDKKMWHNAGNGIIDYYNADVAGANDYAAFGMQMVGRSFNTNAYRYGFNGKEKDNEVKGDGNDLDYGMRNI